MVKVTENIVKKNIFGEGQKYPLFKIIFTSQNYFKLIFFFIHKNNRDTCRSKRYRVVTNNEEEWFLTFNFKYMLKHVPYTYKYVYK